MGVVPGESPGALVGSPVGAGTRVRRRVAEGSRLAAGGMEGVQTHQREGVVRLHRAVEVRVRHGRVQRRETHKWRRLCRWEAVEARGRGWGTHGHGGHRWHGWGHGVGYHGRIAEQLQSINTSEQCDIHSCACLMGTLVGDQRVLRGHQTLCGG